MKVAVEYPMNGRRTGSLFVNGFKLLIDYLAGEAIDCDMQPIAFFSFYDELLREVRSPRRIPSRLGDQVN